MLNRPEIPSLAAGIEYSAGRSGDDHVHQGGNPVHVGFAVDTLHVGPGGI